MPIGGSSITTRGTIWWCEVHELNNPDGQPIQCPADLLGFGSGERCEMVEMRLVPLDALVIEREDGEWPEWITDVDGPVWFQCGGTYDLLDDIDKAVRKRSES